MFCDIKMFIFVVHLHDIVLSSHLSFEGHFTLCLEWLLKTGLTVLGGGRLS